MNPAEDHPSPSPIPSKLQGYPASVQEAFRQFQQSGDAVDLDAFILETLDFLLQRAPDSSLRNLAPETHLRHDLQADSLAITELIFLMEELFNIEIENSEIVGIETMGDLREFCRARVQHRLHG